MDQAGGVPAKKEPVHRKGDTKCAIANGCPLIGLVAGLGSCANQLDRLKQNKANKRRNSGAGDLMNQSRDSSSSAALLEVHVLSLDF